MNIPRVAVICDLKEEGWPSMDLVAEMLLDNLRSNHSDAVKATPLCPAMRRRFTTSFQASPFAFNADRLINRFWDYPRYLRSVRNEFDLFHLVDHSYSQLAHELPDNRVIVTCHDIDSFRCLTDPARDRRGRMFRAMVKRILKGFRKAARVTCDSVATRDEVIRHGLLSPEKVVVIPNGVHPAYSPEPVAQADRKATRLLGPASADCIDILHVGSTIQRKRIDVLLRVFAALLKEFPQARLIRVGGAFTAAQSALAAELNLSKAIITLPFLERDVLAAVYRRAALVLQPSDGEGFGLPVIEAMASGASVIASDIPVLKEVGGTAAAYCRVANVSEWSEQAVALIHERFTNPDLWSARQAAGLAQAGKFTWAVYAQKVTRLFEEVLNDI
ncbi:MAG: glycosyltransferase family 1 protein [Blastocatellia bacterium]